MKHSLLTALLLMTSSLAHGQYWQQVGDGLSDNVYDLIKFEDRLYACGRFGVRYWDGSVWTNQPFPYGIAWPLSIAIYNDTLCVGGDYPSGSNSTSHVYKFNGSSWVPMGDGFDEEIWSSTKVLLNYNEELVSGGHYTSMNGTTLNNIAAWNGITWSGFGDGLNGIVTHLAKYNGDLYASGNFSASGTDTTVQRIAKWNGVYWSSLSSHRFNVAGPMISFDGNLIIGDVWDTISGIPMRGIASWDGTNFTSIGDTTIKGVANFWIHDNTLFLCGKLHNSNPNSADHLVMRWDGNDWHQVGQKFNDNVLTIDDFDGNLYCGGFFTMTGKAPMAFISRMDAADNIASSGTLPSLQIYPNPTIGNITLEVPNKGRLTITNQLGEILDTVELEEHATIINTRTWITGIYYIKFQTNETIAFGKIIKL